MAPVTSRAEIKSLLEDTKRTLFVLSGAADSDVAIAVHTSAERVAESWQRVVWIQDLALLNEGEKEKWLAMGGRYVVITRKTRVPVKWGYTSEFMLSSGKASGVRITAAIAAGDI